MKYQAQTYYAHSRNRDGRRHDLLTHLREVATKAATFAAQEVPANWHTILAFGMILVSLIQHSKNTC